MMMSGYRISQCNPRQLGICSFNCDRNCCSYLNKAPRPPPPPPPPPLRQFPLSTCYSRLLRFKLLGTSASYSSASSSSSSSSSVTNNNDDLAGLSFINNASQPPLLSDCLTPAENDRDPPSEGISSLAGGIVALGKFDAFTLVIGSLQSKPQR
ncbi:fad synthetase 2 chloroplastic [Phtheirospermum japonicum]|uniref:Fad synthetase 2 chloroplastic n=1 Tax=Phtheirospermum japonicum TaxID=374723 RepID=A0A830D753_9LAMI|nr:fad synthetase 2 chloroplastic [Phtheirospermum japonicum]